MTTAYILGAVSGLIAASIWFALCLGRTAKCQCEDCPLKSRCDNGNYPLFEEPKE